MTVVVPFQERCRSPLQPLQQPLSPRYSSSPPASGRSLQVHLLRQAATQTLQAKVRLLPPQARTASLWFCSVLAFGCSSCTTLVINVHQLRFCGGKISFLCANFLYRKHVVYCLILSTEKKLIIVTYLSCKSPDSFVTHHISMQIWLVPR